MGLKQSLTLIVAAAVIFVPSLAVKWKMVDVLTHPQVLYGGFIQADLPTSLGLGPKNFLKPLDVVRAGNGHVIRKFRQTFNGLDVFGSYIVVNEAGTSRRKPPPTRRRAHSKAPPTGYVISAVYATNLHTGQVKQCTMSDQELINLLRAQGADDGMPIVKEIRREPVIFVAAEGREIGTAQKVSVAYHNHEYTRNFSYILNPCTRQIGVIEDVDSLLQIEATKRGDIWRKDPYKKSERKLDSTQENAETEDEDLERDDQHDKIEGQRREKDEDEGRRKEKFFENLSRKRSLEMMTLLNYGSRKRRGKSQRGHAGRKLGEPCENQVFGVGGTARMGPILYGRWPFCLDVEIEQKFNRLQGKTRMCRLRNKYIEVYDLKNSLFKPVNATPVYFPCSRGYRDDVNGGASPSLDAFFFTTETALMLKDWFHYERLVHPPVQVFVHYGVAETNAFANQHRQIFFGNGGTASDNSYYPFPSAPNVAPHEYGHLVTKEAAGLVYRDVSGGLNEAFSDMMAELAELHLFGSVDWEVSKFLSKVGLSLRSFEVNRLKQIRNLSEFVKGMDVHDSSGIFSTAFRQMARYFGTFGVLEILLLANRMYWHRTVGFESSSCGIARAACDMGYDMVPVSQALRDVGVTFSECPDFSVFIPEATEDWLPNIRVSKFHRPLYKLKVKPGTRGLIVRTNHKGLILEVRRDWQANRSSVKQSTVGTILKLIFNANRVRPYQNLFIELRQKTLDIKKVAMKISVF